MSVHVVYHATEQPSTSTRRIETREPERSPVPRIETQEQAQPPAPLASTSVHLESPAQTTHAISPPLAAESNQDVWSSSSPACIRHTHVTLTPTPHTLRLRLAWWCVVHCPPLTWQRFHTRVTDAASTHSIPRDRISPSTTTPASPSPISEPLISDPHPAAATVASSWVWQAVTDQPAAGSPAAQLTVRMLLVVHLACLFFFLC